MNDVTSYCVPPELNRASLPTFGLNESVSWLGDSGIDCECGELGMSTAGSRGGCRITVSPLDSRDMPDRRCRLPGTVNVERGDDGPGVAAAAQGGLGK